MKNLIVLSTLLFAGACAKVASSPNAITDSRTTTSAGTAAASTEIRQCSDVLSNTTAGKLFSFFGKPVSNVEGGVTYCLRLSGSGSIVSGSSLRIEYEDDAGVRSYDTTLNNVQVLGGKIDIDTSGNAAIEVIFVDGSGFVQVKGTAPSGGQFTGAISYYNAPVKSFDEQLQDQIDAAQQKCKNGTYTVAQCLGYNFPVSYWWNETYYVSPTAAMLAQARTILGDASKTTQLGTISAELSAIWSQ